MLCQKVGDFKTKIMKLYTEEQIRQTFRNGFLYAMSNQLNEDAIVDSLTPIELPSDEEIEIQKPFGDITEPSSHRGFQGWIKGAKWLKTLILSKLEVTNCDINNKK